MAQTYNKFHKKVIIVTSDTLKYDTTITVNGSLILKNSENNIISDSLYNVNWAKSEISFNKSIRGESITIIYRTLYDDIFKPFYHKKVDKLLISNTGTEQYIYRSNQNNFSEDFGKDDLIKQGSISRGISFGNNQDVVVNSNLNLQLSGKLTKDLNIIASITDNNIPIQPEGNTQQIQDFDKVFITIYNKTLNLTIGDFELNQQKDNYLLMNKKVQGINIANNFNVGKNKKSTYKSTITGSVSKGKYNRLSFNGSEGIQGPYRLTGTNNEPYIIIIAGSEKVYIDGKQLERGQENDYVIDYNTAELSFTANQPITKDKRIIIEYEYSDKNYARFLIFSGNEFYTKNNSKYWLNIFSEQDSKNQTLQQDLTDNEKRILANAGDSSSLAVVPYITLDTVFKNDMVFYKMADTLVNTILYDSIFVYSTNADSAIYRVGFSYVGFGKGNYNQISSSANGRVFKWVAPVNNVKQGDYEPIRQLIAPKLKTVMTTGGSVVITNNLKFNYELGISKNDKNTFSKLNDGDNNGTAFKSEISKSFFMGDSSKTKLIVSAYFQNIDRRFESVERYKTSEFERDWNLTNNNNLQNEITSGININYNKLHISNINYGIDYMNRQNIFTGFKNKIYGKISSHNFDILINGSYLKSNDTLKTTDFTRHRISVQKNIHKFFVGVANEQEINKWKNNKTDSLFLNSTFYRQYEATSGFNDTLKKSFIFKYKNRTDYNPDYKKFKMAVNSNDYNLTANFFKNVKNNLKTTLTYRTINLIDTNVTNVKEENNFTGLLEHNVKIFKSLIQINTVYETGSGLEMKKEFSYLEVPAGQGVYTWTDYNNNGIKELNEFETAVFQDQAKYIRIFTTTNNYEKINNSKITQIIYLKPEVFWGTQKGIKKFVSRFSEQIAYNFDNKLKSNNILERVNPFTFGLVNDSMINYQNKNIRNTLSFNKTNQNFGIDYLIQNNKSNVLLINGIDTRTLNQHSVQFRVNINKSINTNLNLSAGNKSFSSQYFATKNYNLNLKSTELFVNIQTSNSFRVAINSKMSEKTNKSGIEKTKLYNTGLECRYNILEKGNFVFKADYFFIKYIGEVNSAVGYEMLEGLYPGNNSTWEMQYQHNISNTLQMSISYNGRISQDSKAVHIGTLQMRAFF